jgi:hypothetical protein
MHDLGALSGAVLIVGQNQEGGASPRIALSENLSRDHSWNCVTESLPSQDTETNIVRQLFKYIISCIKEKLVRCRLPPCSFTTTSGCSVLRRASIDGNIGLSCHDNQRRAAEEKLHTGLE